MVFENSLLGKILRPTKEGGKEQDGENSTKRK
jgi:hypothetical protein